MKRSIRSKLILALTTLITAALIISGAIVIWQNIENMRQDIYLDSLTFGDLTNDKIITSFEQFYKTENFLQFRKEINPLINKQSDLSKIQVIGKSGELFYDFDQESDVAYIGAARKHSYILDRARDIKPSLLFSGGEIIYVKKSASNEWMSVDAQEQVITFPSGEVQNIVYPHKNARLSVVYTLQYDALWQRIYQMIASIVGVIIFSIVLVSGFAVYLAKKMVEPIQELEKGVVKIGEGALGTQVNVITDDEVGVLAENFNTMSITLKKNTEELLIKEAMTKELNIAREIQDNLLPKKAPEVSNLELSGSLNPASHIGGDIFDYYTSDKKITYIFIADVTGHGVPAGMIANITHSTLYSFSKIYEKTDEIMKSMNSVIHAKTKRNMFATALLTRWDEKARTISYCNAGHEQIIHYKAKEKKSYLVGKGGMALGMIASLDKLLKEQSFVLEPNDVIALYTDGIPEAWKTEKENLGMDRLQEIVNAVSQEKQDAVSIREGILANVTEFRNNYPQQDDITLVIMRAK